MFGNSWNKEDENELANLDLTMSSLRMLDETAQKGFLFKAIRAADLPVIRTILQANIDLLNSKMYGYEGSDVYGVIKDSKTKRCYTHTGIEKDGFFYPLHVAAEAGHKQLTILLVRAGADINAVDCRGATPEKICNGDAKHAFFELRGFKFEAKERYVGKTDRQGQRHGQGTLFYKPEGYEQEEKQLYRGSFKNNLYHGHGTLYYPGTDKRAYVGRFKDGYRHGRGIEFDQAENKIYQGTFRDDVREGFGEEYVDNMKVYRGEFSNNIRHGFGIAYYPENSKYFGRYENGSMTGIGIFCHPNGDRFEGMFFNNRPDGPGSFYERDPYTGNFTGSHWTWQAGKKVKELNTPFVPTLADLPDDTNKNLFVEIMNAHSQQYSLDGENDVLDGSNDPSQRYPKSNNESKTNGRLPQKKRTSFLYFDGIDPGQYGISKSEWWKVQLGKYLKIPLKEARFMGINLPEHLFQELNRSGDGDSKSNEEEPSTDDEQPEADTDIDEVTGYHFLECTALFTAYMYVNSAARVFDDRLANKEFTSVFPDFDAVRHLVIDAVDCYNEKWEEAYKEEQTQDHLASTSSTTASAPMASHANANNNGANIESRRMMFMSEKEKKEELILKQRAELAIKKGTAELDPEIEHMISLEVIQALQAELAKLLTEDNEQRVHMNLPISRKTLNDDQHKVDLPAVPSSSPNTPEKTANKGGNPIQKSSGKDKVKEEIGVGRKKKKEDERVISIVNIDDLFDDMSALGNASTDDDNLSADQDDEAMKGNEFAAELLYIMKLSVGLT